MCALLFGCGGSSTLETPVAVSVVNKSDIAYASAVVVDPNDNQIYETKMSCSDLSGPCSIAIPDVDHPATMVFKDSRGRMVGALSFSRGIPSEADIYPSSLSTGMYLAFKLTKALKEEGVDRSEFYLRLATFFQNYASADGSLDQYEELGDYYRIQLKKTKLSETEILAQLKQRLMDWEVAEASEMQAPQLASGWWRQIYASVRRSISSGNVELVRTAHASGGCSDGVLGFLAVISGVASAVAGAFPVAGGGVVGATGIVQHFCGSADGTMAEILSRLETLQNSVNEVSQQVGRMAWLLSESGINPQLAAFDQIVQDARGLRENHKRFLSNNKVKSLAEFFEKSGGWNAGLALGGRELRDLLEAPNPPSTATRSPSLARFRDLILSPNVNTYWAALNDRCAPQLNSNDGRNLVEVRADCNSRLLANLGYLFAAHGTVLPVFKEVYEVLDRYANVVQVNGARVLNDFPLPSGVPSFAEAYTTIQGQFRTHQDTLVTEMRNRVGGNGFYDLHAGLNADLRNNITRLNCALPGAAPRNSLPSISGIWVGNSDSNQWYIETDCRVGNENRRIKARYRFRDQGSGVNVNEVANILGVLVASRYNAGNGWWMYNNTSSSYTFARKASGYSVESSPIVAFNSQQQRNGQAVVSQGEGGSQAEAKGWLRGSPSNPWAEENNNTWNYNYNWVVFKGSDNFHYAMYLVLGGRNGWGYSYCMTADCSVEDSFNLRFRNGSNSVRVNFFDQIERGNSGRFRVVVD